MRYCVPANPVCTGLLFSFPARLWRMPTVKKVSVDIGSFPTQNTPHSTELRELSAVSRSNPTKAWELRIRCFGIHVSFSGHSALRFFLDIFDRPGRAERAHRIDGDAAPQA